jgi:hypothetical protein
MKTFTAPYTHIVFLHNRAARQTTCYIYSSISHPLLKTRHAGMNGRWYCSTWRSRYNNHKKHISAPSPQPCAVRHAVVRPHSIRAQSTPRGNIHYIYVILCIYKIIKYIIKIIVKLICVIYCHTKFLCVRKLDCVTQCAIYV